LGVLTVGVALLFIVEPIERGFWKWLLVVCVLLGGLGRIYQVLKGD
jgi:hypothetical protein